MRDDVSYDILFIAYLLNVDYLSLFCKYCLITTLVAAGCTACAYMAPYSSYFVTSRVETVMNTHFTVTVF